MTGRSSGSGRAIVHAWQSRGRTSSAATSASLRSLAASMNAATRRPHRRIMVDTGPVHILSATRPAALVAHAAGSLAGLRQRRHAALQRHRQWEDRQQLTQSVLDNAGGLAAGPLTGLSATSTPARTQLHSQPHTDSQRQRRRARANVLPAIMRIRRLCSVTPSRAAT